jgi:hypothetical protein
MQDDNKIILLGQVNVNEDISMTTIGFLPCALWPNWL